jgi:selenide,water dikinase
MRIALCDPQTSGGLLISVPKEKVDALMEAMERRGVKWATVVGEIIAEPVGEVFVEP